MTQRRKQAWTKWRKLVCEQGRSGQSVAAFCRGRGLCAPQFFVWKKRLAQAEVKKFVEVKVAAAVVAPRAAADGTTIEVGLVKDRRLLVRPGFDAQHLQALVAALESQA